IPSLKPRTAPPRSAPMLRSFFVPKISITITRTISQCQMLNEPIWCLLFPSVEHRPQGLRAAQDMHMDMIHLLMAHTPRVDDAAEALRSSFLAREFAGEREHPAERLVVAHVGFVQAGHVHLGNDQEVHRRLRPH